MNNETDNIDKNFVDLQLLDKKQRNTIVSRKRAHYGLSAHPPVFPQFPTEV